MQASSQHESTLDPHIASRPRSSSGSPRAVGPHPVPSREEPGGSLGTLLWVRYADDHAPAVASAPTESHWADHQGPERAVVPRHACEG